MQGMELFRKSLEMFWEAPFKDDHAVYSIPDYTTNDLEARMYTIE